MVNAQNTSSVDWRLRSSISWGASKEGIHMMTRRSEKKEEKLTIHRAGRE